MISYKKLVHAIAEASKARICTVGRRQGPRKASMQSQSEGWQPAEFPCAQGGWSFCSVQAFNYLGKAHHNKEGNLLTQSLPT